MDLYPDRDLLPDALEISLELDHQLPDCLYLALARRLGAPMVTADDKLIRKEDHAGIIDCYISRVENGRLEVKKKIPKEELVKHMPVRFNLSTMPA